MCLQGEVRVPSTAQTPNLDCPIQTSTRECICILRVDSQAHNIVAMALKRLHALPALIPIPQLDSHIITGGEDKRLCGMHDNRADIVRVGFERRDLLRGVVVEHTEMKVVGTDYEPILSGDKATGAHGDISNLEGLDESLGFVGPDVDMTLIEYYCQRLTSPRLLRHRGA